MKNHIDSSAIGHVIRIIDNYTVIVDAGKSKLSIGDVIQIYAPGEPILGLDGKELCKFIHVKDTLDVIDVQNSYSLCKKNKEITHKINFDIPLSPMLEHIYTEQEPLAVSANEVEKIATVDKKIHVGDFIKLAWHSKTIMVRWNPTEMVVVEMTSENPSYR